MSDKMTTCKACGKEIAKSAKKCPNCGADQRNFFGKHKIITAILALFIIGVIGAAASGGGNDKPASTAAPATQQDTAQPAATPAQAPATEPAKNKPTITKAEFEQIKSGMTYEEVSAIIGGPGEVLSESGNKGDQYHTVIYSYKGEGEIGANANFTFQGNQLQNKAQMGLK